MATVTDMAIMRNCEVISDKFNADGKYAQKELAT
jgi:hypothetical protein